MKRTVKIPGLFMSVCYGLILLAGCSGTTIQRVDTIELEGILVVGYLEDPVVRTRVEDQLVADLIEQEFIALVSYEDIVDVIQSTPQQLIDAALEKKALGIIVIHQVAADASDSIEENPNRVTPLHPSLQAYYASSRELAGESFTQEQEAFADVNLFLLNNGEAKLWWSGTVWSFNVDNQGRAIRDMSNTIVQQLSAIREQLGL